MRRPARPRPGVTARMLRRCATVLGVGMVGATACTAGLWVAGGPAERAGRPVAGVVDRTPRAMTGQEATALALLERSAAAARTTAYSGTKYLTGRTGRGPTVLEVRHRPGTGSWLRVVAGSGASASAGEPSAAGSPTARSSTGGSSRTGSDPSAGSPGVGPDHLVADPTGGLDGVALAALGRHYRLQVLADPARCAGRDVQVVQAVVRSGSAAGHVAGRFWLDGDTGLLLRRELYAADGAVLAASVFVDVSMGPAAAAPPVAASPRPSGTPVGRSAGTDLDDAALRRLRAAGWPLPDVLPGGLQRFDARSLDGGSTVQLSFTDGLFAVSVFVQRGRLGAAPADGFRRATVAGSRVWVDEGRGSTVVWSDGRHVFTVLTDGEDAAAAVAALPHRSGGDGLRARLSRGIARVGSWVDPSAGITMPGRGGRR